MLDVLGLDPLDPGWPTTGGGDSRLTDAVDVLVAGLLEHRAEARAAKDWAPPTQIRDQIKAAGIEVEDTPAGPDVDLSAERSTDARQLERRGAIRKTAKKPTAGSGGRVKRGLEGRGPTPKAKDRPNHKVYKQKRQGGRGPPRPGRAAATPAARPSGSPAATPSSRRCGPASRSRRVYVAEGAERDGRLREAFKLASRAAASACSR